MGVDIPVNCSFQSYQKPGRHCASGQLSELTIYFFGATNLVTVEVDIPVDRSFQSYHVPKTLRAGILATIGATKNLEDTMLPVKYRS